MSEVPLSSSSSAGAAGGGSASREVHTRVWMGLVMIVLSCGVLILDRHLAPYYPCLLVTLAALGYFASAELHGLMATHPRPPRWLLTLAVEAVLLANWPAHLGWTTAGPWRDVQVACGAAVLAGFLWEMATYRAPGGSVSRISLLLFAVGYLGVLPSFLAQLRWWPAGQAEADLRGEAALALTFFVPKFCDIGAFFTGRLLGRHPMTPRLSPKKTWEGLAGGLVASVLIAAAINHWVWPVAGGVVAASLVGLVLGVAGVLGDLAESLIKRDGGQKDASHSVPGFGGILDVVDSILFAAPVAWAVLRMAE